MACAFPVWQMMLAVSTAEVLSYKPNSVQRGNNLMSTFWVPRGGDLAAFSTEITVFEICYKIPSRLNLSEFSWFVSYWRQPPHQKNRDAGWPQLLRKKMVKDSTIGWALALCQALCQVVYINYLICLLTLWGGILIPVIQKRIVSPYSC